MTCKLTIWLKLRGKSRYCQGTSVDGKTLGIIIVTYKNEIIVFRQITSVKKVKYTIQKGTKRQSICLASLYMFAQKLSKCCQQHIDSEWFSICPQRQNICLLRIIGLLILVNSFYTPEKILWSSLSSPIIYL